MATLGLASPVLIVAGKTAVAVLSDIWRISLEDAGFAYHIYRFRGECSIAEIERVKQQARNQSVRAIIGAGGGKVLDTARAAAADLEIPVVNCPTAASSDAPCSALSVIYNDDGTFLQYRIYGKNPDLVLVDTQVIAQSPPRLLVAGMGDALATWFEAKTCVEGNVKNMRGGGSSQSALALAELCYRILLRDGADALAALQNQSPTPALERLVEANTLLSGLGFESSGLAAAHAVHNGLTAVPQTHAYFHGEKVAYGVLVQLILEKKSQPLLEEVLGFATRVGLPTTLAAIGLAGMTDEMLDQIATRSAAEGETIHNEPFPVQPRIVAEAIRAADSLGREWNRKHGVSVAS
jgi:glycerol dehydrogenase